MRTHLVFSVKLYLVAPLLSQASGGGAYGFSTTALRSVESGTVPVFPGSLVRGNLRHVWQYFIQRVPSLKGLNQDVIDAWLGEASPQGSQDEPKRGRLHFAYAWQAQSSSIPSRMRHRIAVDPKTGTVVQGALQVIEEPFTSGENICFHGIIKASVDTEEEAHVLTYWLRKGLEYIPALGAFKGTGFGRLLRVEIEPVHYFHLSKSSDVWQPPQEGIFGIRLCLDRPICFARPHQAGSNRFESYEWIPGAAIRGVLARSVFGEGEVSTYPNLRRYFDHIYIKHALPVNAGIQTRPVVIPLSFASVSQDKKWTLYDLSQKASAGLIHQQAPTFQSDWKKTVWEQARQLCGQSPLQHRIDVHTAIDPLTGTTQEGALFTLETVQTQNHEWISEVNCRQVPLADRKAVLQELYTLFMQGLDGLGKTKASATVQCLTQPLPFFVQTSALSFQKDKKLVLILQSAARLLPDPYRIPSTNGGDELKQRYQKVWRQLSEESLTLSHFYAHQGLVGGAYLQHRFWSSITSPSKTAPRPYNPEVLTLPGSVFVFTVNDLDKAQLLVKTWLTDGLPQPSEAVGGENWQHNPYLAANGYGEILVNPLWKLPSVEEGWYAL